MTTDSRLVETQADAPGDLTALENSLREATAKPKPQEKNSNKAPDAKPERPEWIQEKFWTGELNESAARQAQAYVNLQSAYGRMANDLGTQRKLTDQILALGKRSADLTEQPVREAPKLPEVDAKKLVTDPTKTLNEYYEARRKAEREEEQANAAKAQRVTAETQFVTNHPDWTEVTETPEFRKWVESSKTRQRVAAAAGQGDFYSADALLSEYKDSLKTQDPPAKDESLEAARKVALESSAQSGGSSGESAKSGRVYRRADLIRLKMEKPEVYGEPTFQAEIMAAYREGRVK